MLWALRDGDRQDLRLRVRLRQPGDAAQLQAPAQHARPLHASGGAAADARQPRLRRLRARVRRGEPWVEEVTYDTPFGDGYMLGTFVQRTAKLGDGLVVFLTDVTTQRRMEAELRSYADVVAHDLREPVSGMAMLVGAAGAPRRGAAAPRRAAAAAGEHRAGARADRRRAGLRAHGRAAPRAGRARRAHGRGGRGPAARASRTRARRWRSASCPRSTATGASSAACSRTSWATRSSSAPRRRRVIDVSARRGSEDGS